MLVSEVVAARNDADIEFVGVPLASRQRRGRHGEVVRAEEKRRRHGQPERPVAAVTSQGMSRRTYCQHRSHPRSPPYGHRPEESLHPKEELIRRNVPADGWITPD